MNDLYDIFYYAFLSAALLLSGVGLWFTAIIPGLDRWSKRFFLCYFAAFILCGLSSMLEAIPLYVSVSKGTFYTILAVESLFLSLPLPMLTVYLLHCRGETLRGSKLLRAVTGLWAVYCVLVATSPILGHYTYITPDNHYQRGPLYPLCLLPLLLILLLNLAGTIRNGKRLPRKVLISFLVSILPMTLAVTVQMFVDAYALLDISYVLSALSMYGFILSDQIEQDLRRQRELARQQQEIANQRASIMVLQMRPHFIYNTLMSIYSLCNQDPRKARQVTLDFTNYLRKNFNAVASESAVPFTTELEHSRAYLAVEQAQFEELLVVEYDTPHTRFRLPPLTLQPLVENAVKHGMDPYAGPLHVRVQTRHKEASSVITVADDGKGFDASDERMPHLTLRNIRQRLESMCGGTMTIQPNPGGGTLVTLTIPDDTAESRSVQS